MHLDIMDKLNESLSQLEKIEQEINTIPQQASDEIKTKVHKVRRTE